MRGRGGEDIEGLEVINAQAVRERDVGGEGEGAEDVGFVMIETGACGEVGWFGEGPSYIGGEFGLVGEIGGLRGGGYGYALRRREMVEVFEYD
jgi:hypothetical protein